MSETSDSLLPLWAKITAAAAAVGAAAYGVVTVLHASASATPSSSTSSSTTVIGSIGDVKQQSSTDPTQSSRTLLVDEVCQISQFVCII
jgi:hypothetical protein